MSMPGSSGGNNVIGGQIPDLQGLQANFNRQSQAVDDLMANLNTDVHDTWWVGGAADRFKSAWESEYQPALKRLSQALVDASNEVHNRVQALIAAGA